VTSRNPGPTRNVARSRDFAAWRRVCASVEAYYSAKLARHGATPLGVDWSCTASQWLRFVQLLKVCRFDKPFSLNDLGCGYGALAAFLSYRHSTASIDYLGIDLCPAMVRRARRRNRGDPHNRFAVGWTCPRQADYTVASGIMNVTLGFPMPLWEKYVRSIMLDMYRNSRCGFAVNFLSEPTLGAPPDQLYCPSPETWRQFFSDELGCSVDLLSDYGMKEFTLLVRCDRRDGDHEIR
jgi:SAM-dependent methyltransferase